LSVIRDTFDFAASAINQALGDEVEYNGKRVMAVYGNEFAAVLSGEVRVSSRRPEITVRLDDLDTPPKQGDRVVVRGLTFEVATVRYDVEDVTATLMLKKV